VLAGSYNNLLVWVSIGVAMLASYTALDMVERVTNTSGRVSLSWLAGGATAMGVGIWSMHFIGMLAFSLPIELGYDPFLTAISLLIAIALSAFALWLVAQQEMPLGRLVLGALLMGAGVAGMHYTGMAAMRMTPGIKYNLVLLITSIAIAVVASGAALWIAFSLRRRKSRILRLAAAVVMGIAIVTMHYTGMAAAEFPVGSICGAVRAGIDSNHLALPVIMTTLFILALAIVISILDMRLEVRTSVLASSLAEANEELMHLALHDTLTKLPNRALFEDRLSQSIQSSDRENTRFSLMFIDLDGFKAINDSYGHHIGDLLLVEMAQRLRANVRGQDTIARVGGDEFVLLAKVTDPEDAATLAEKLVHVIGQPFMSGGNELRVSASIGIAVYPGNGHHNFELIKNADAAMYHAKSLGRNGYCFFEPSMNANAQEQLKLLQDLRGALERHELILQYQPKYAAPGGQVVGAEALIRWQHPVHGMIPPDKFIPLAEKTGLIVQIGAWVVNEACRQLAAWHRAGHTTWTMAVNLSPVQFSHDRLFEMVRDILIEHRVEPYSLTLEVTESTVMKDVEQSLAILTRLHDLGVCISIDDFGTGYSSLMYLKRLPARELKIDRGFIRELEHDAEDAAIVSAIVGLGQTLNLQIVAEGVETLAQQEFLTRLGCDSLQGFLLGRPMSALAFTDRLLPAPTDATVVAVPDARPTGLSTGLSMPAGV
jgi:diguanylate cyclase (GGDEF)-like protein